MAASDGDGGILSDWSEDERVRAKTSPIFEDIKSKIKDFVESTEKDGSTVTYTALLEDVARIFSEKFDDLSGVHIDHIVAETQLVVPFLPAEVAAKQTGNVRKINVTSYLAALQREIKRLYSIWNKEVAPPDGDPCSSSEKPVAFAILTRDDISMPGKVLDVQGDSSLFLVAGEKESMWVSTEVLKDCDELVFRELAAQRLHCAFVRFSTSQV